MIDLSSLFLFLSGFLVISLASKQVGKFFGDYKLPLISGFLFNGVIAGPYVLGLIGSDAISALGFIDEIALGFIAFIAGSEIYIEEFKNRFKSIRRVTIGLTIFIIVFVTAALLMMGDYIPFLSEMSGKQRFVVSILAAGILCAISPSSTVAVIKELRAKGPFVLTALGTTVFMDVIVIVLFAVNSSIVDAVFHDVSFNFGFILFLIFEIFISIVIGVLLGKIIQCVIKVKVARRYRAITLLALGYGVFFAARWIKLNSAGYIGVTFVLEPLLICMIGSFFVANYTDQRDDFLAILHKTSFPVYIAFFTLIGASLKIDVLASVWPIALALFAMRLLGSFVGGFAGSMSSGENSKFGSLIWMGFVTQAGVSLGLAKEVTVAFPDWGSEFSTLIIGVIVINQLIGPMFFKWAIFMMRESHIRKSDDKFDAKRDAIIFGASGQSATLALQLKSHNWSVKIACPRRENMRDVLNSEITIHPLPDHELDTIRSLDAKTAGAFVFMLTDEENYALCEQVYEHFGEAQMIVLLNDRANYDKFKELGCLIVAPSTAIISLLDHFVRSPSGASLLLGMEDHQDIIDITVRNPNLYGVNLKDLRLPMDVLVVSIHRDGKLVDIHGNVRFQVGDSVTAVGTEESLEEVAMRFS